MTDKEFKRLGRAQLIDIIYQLQLQVDKLTEQNQALEKALADKRLRISNAGNIAEAALEISDCFRSAQNAAEQYLGEIEAIRADAEAMRAQILDQAQKEAEAIRADAEADAGMMLISAQNNAEAIVAATKKKHNAYAIALETILKEYGQDPSDNG